jgi:hypothetical protein
MNMMFAARFFDWAFLLALLLLDDLGAARILEEVALDPESADGVYVSGHFPAAMYALPVLPWCVQVLDLT